MKVEVENQPHCVATLKIELPPEQVSQGMGRDREQLCRATPESRDTARGKRPAR